MAKMYQVSTLQALMLGDTRSVVTVSELLEHGDTGLGTFEDVDGEMIVIDGACYRATEDGTVEVAEPDKGVPFSAVCTLRGSRAFDLGAFESVDALKAQLTLMCALVHEAHAAEVLRRRLRSLLAVRVEAHLAVFRLPVFGDQALMFEPFAHVLARHPLLPFPG